MSAMPRRYWHEMTSKDFAQLEVDRVIAVLPIGAIEQHGPHLPVWVDSCIGQGILGRTVALMPPTLPVTILPPLAVSKSDEHLAFPGTLSLHGETLLRVLTELGECVWRTGLRKLVLFNSHGGNPGVLELVAHDLRARLTMLVVRASWFDFGLPDGLFADERERRHGIHGGAVETAMMLHLAPELVRQDERRDYPSLAEDMAQHFRHLGAVGGLAFGWQAQDLNLYGACGNALDADADRGRQLVDFYAERLVELLRDVDRFPLEALKGRV